MIIVGDGPDKIRLKKIVAERGLGEIVFFAGKVSMEGYRKLMQESDVVVNAALKEGAVTVSFDTMASGKPLICLDTTGYTRYFTNEYAILIPRVGRQEVVRRMADAMLRLTDPVQREQLGRNALEASSRFSWENHGKEIRDAITAAYTSYSTK